MRFVPQWLFRSSRAYRRWAGARDEFAQKLNAAGDAAWVAPARALLQMADNRMAQQDLSTAWSHLQAAMREQILGLRGQELWSYGQALRCEAVKVPSKWRKSAIDQFLKEEELAEEDRARRLKSAQAMLDDHYRTLYYKNGLLQDQMRNLVVLTIVALLALLVLVGWAGTDLAQWPPWDWKMLLVVLLFGVLGASFSATRKLSDDSGRSKIPEMAANVSITVARAVLGATPALAAYALLKSGFLTIGGGGTGQTPVPVVLAVSFAAGFSERLVLKVLESIGSKGEGKADGKSGQQPASDSRS